MVFCFRKVFSADKAFKKLTKKLFELSACVDNDFKLQLVSSTAFKYRVQKQNVH